MTPIIHREIRVVHSSSKPSKWDASTDAIVKDSPTPTSRPPKNKYLGEVLKRAWADKIVGSRNDLPEMLGLWDKFRDFFEESTQAERGSDVKRDTQLIVMPKLKPVEGLDQGADVKDVLTGVVKGYIWLHQKTLILHRNINTDSIMYHNQDGKICGILNDFDLAQFTDNQANGTLPKRVGTRPFMARDLLGGVSTTHLRRHDLESIMYVTVVLACFRHASLDEQKSSPIGTWFDPDITEGAIRSAKDSFFNKPSPITSGTMTCLARVVKDLINLFRVAQAKSLLALVDEAPFDSETLGGVVTLKSFGEIFSLSL